MDAYYITIAICLFGLALAIYIPARRQTKLDAEWERQHPRSLFLHCGKTLLFYEPSHGNQLEYLDPNGRCYLWYPGNPIVLRGLWKADEGSIYFRYGINTYNPVTGVVGGTWEGCRIELWSLSIVDTEPGDPLKLISRLPYVLDRHPALRSVQDAIRRK